MALPVDQFGDVGAFGGQFGDVGAFGGIVGQPVAEDAVGRVDDEPAFTRFTMCPREFICPGRHFFVKGAVDESRIRCVLYLYEIAPRADDDLFVVAGAAVSAGARGVVRHDDYSNTGRPGRPAATHRVKPRVAKCRSSSVPRSS